MYIIVIKKIYITYPQIPNELQTCNFQMAGDYPENLLPHRLCLFLCLKCSILSFRSAISSFVLRRPPPENFIFSSGKPSYKTTYRLIRLYKYPGIIRLFHLNISRQSSFYSVNGFIENSSSCFGTKFIKTRHHPINIFNI